MESNEDILKQFRKSGMANFIDFLNWKDKQEKQKEELEKPKQVDIQDLMRKQKKK